jgi:hypothetical protein
MKVAEEHQTIQKKTEEIWGKYWNESWMSEKKEDKKLFIQRFYMI